MLTRLRGWSCLGSGRKAIDVTGRCGSGLGEGVNICHNGVAVSNGRNRAVSPGIIAERYRAPGCDRNAGSAWSESVLPASICAAPVGQHRDLSDFRTSRLRRFAAAPSTTPKATPIAVEAATLPAATPTATRYRRASRRWQGLCSRSPLSLRHRFVGVPCLQRKMSPMDRVLAITPVRASIGSEDPKVEWHGQLRLRDHHCRRRVPTTVRCPPRFRDRLSGASSLPVPVPSSRSTSR
jgi:hypothetical protein